MSEKFKDRREQRITTETMNALLLPMTPYLNDETKAIVEKALCLLNSIEIEQEPILDKIRAEIEQLTFEYDKSIGIDDTRTDAEKSSDWWKMEKLIVLQIIDKYKAESEDKG